MNKRPARLHLGCGEPLVSLRLKRKSHGQNRAKDAVTGIGRVKGTAARGRAK